MKFEKKFEERETKFYEGADLSSLVLTRNTDIGYPRYIQCKLFLR